MIIPLVIAIIGCFGCTLNIYVVLGLFLVDVLWGVVNSYQSELSSKNKYSEFFSKLSASSLLDFTSWSIIFYSFGLYTALLLPLFYFTLLCFSIESIGVIFFLERYDADKLYFYFLRMFVLCSFLVYANTFGFLNYFTSPFSLSLYFLPVIIILGLIFNPFNVDEKGRKILFGAFKVENWNKFLFAFVVQASFMVLLCIRNHPELLTLLFGIPTLPYIYGVILLMPLVYLHASLSEFVFTGLPLLIHRWLSSNDSEMMIKMGCCFLSVVLFALLHMGSFPFTLLGVLHCFASTLPTSVTLLAITFYSGGVEYSLGLRYAITLLSLILFPGAINGSLVASVSLMQIFWDFLDASLKMVVPVLLVFFYEKNYYKGWSGKNVTIDQIKDRIGLFLNEKAKKSDGYQLFYDILTGLNISSEQDWKLFYKAASIEFHPDKKGGYTKYFQSLNSINMEVKTTGNYMTYGILQIIKELEPAVKASEFLFSPLAIKDVPHNAPRLISKGFEKPMRMN